MSNAHNVKIFLLDNSFLQIPVQPRLIVGELRDLVASHVNVRERCYFGLAYKEEGGGWNWLSNIKRVLDHDIPKVNGQLVLHFLVQFYLESVRLLSDTNAYEQFYLQARHSLSEGELICEPQMMFRLIAFIMQIVYGDYQDDKSAVNNLKKLNAFPTWLFRSHPSLEFCEIQVLEYYRSNIGMEKGEALLDFLIVLESLPSYGYHYYEVQDKSHNSWWLGLNCRGIFLYDYTDKSTPRNSYLWPQFCEIHHGRQKLILVVQKRKKRSSSSNRRGFTSSTDNTSSSTSATITWHTTTQRAKVIAFAVNEYYKFFEHRRATSRFYAPLREREDVSFELTHRRHSFSRLNANDVSGCNGHRLHQFSYSSGNLAINNAVNGETKGVECHTDQFAAIDDMSREEAIAQREKLKDKKLVLMQSLLMKEAEMKRLLNEEFELTGAMPEEYNSPVASRQRIFQRTSFLLSPCLVKKAAGRCQQNEVEQLVTKLELEFAAVKQIYAVNKKMARDTRKKNYKIACKGNLEKLKKLQDELDSLRHTPAMRNHQHHWLTSRVSELSCSLTNTTDTGSTRRTEDSKSDSISLNSSCSSMDVSRRMSQTSLPEAAGPVFLRDTLLGSSRSSLSTTAEDPGPSPSPALDNNSTDFASFMQPLRADCYMGHYSSPSHLARARYRDIMLFNDPPSCSTTTHTSTPKAPSVPEDPLSAEEAGTLVRTSHSPLISTKAAGKSTFSDSGFVSLHKCDSSSSPTTPRRHSNGTLTRKPSSDGAALLADPNSRFSAVEVDCEDVDQTLCARVHRLSVSDNHLFFSGDESGDTFTENNNQTSLDDPSGPDEVFSPAPTDRTSVVPKFRYGRTYTAYQDPRRVITPQHQQI